MLTTSWNVRGILASTVLAFVGLGCQMDHLQEEQSHLIEQCELAAGSASQGVALADTAYYGSTSSSVCRFD
ncbi:MAG: hypothetical protein QGH20_02235, partial [Candidatus Latescibacteria bacterium]|nr:hypothetical protein [Candidatus Latescibacterota bacterium]